MRKPVMEESLSILQSTGLPIHSVLDVGVQYGTRPLMNIFRDKPHYLFEPISEYFPKIRTNYAGIEHQIIEAAVSDQSGTVHLKSEDKTGASVATHSYIVENAGEATRSVPAITLDSFVAANGVPEPFLLKIDVEGADVPARILRGASAMLSRASAVVIEMTVPRFMERATLLHQAGFRLWDIVDLCYYDSLLWQCDVIFINQTMEDGYPKLRSMGRGNFDKNLWQSGIASA